MLNEKHITEYIDEKNKKELPIYTPPPIYYSHWAAFSFSVLLSTSKSFEWFYSNFIQLRISPKILEPYVKKGPFLHMYPLQWIFGPNDAFGLFIAETNINEKIIEINVGNFLEYMINWLKNDYYIVIRRADMSFIPNTKYFGHKPHLHTLFCFAYDTNKQIFKCLDFDDNGKYTTIDVKFDDFLNAKFSERSNYDGYKHYISLLKIRDNISFSLDIEKIKEQIIDYLNSNNSSKKYNLFIPEPESNCVYGININKFMKHYINIRKKDVCDNIDYRAFHAIWEHKKIMISRIEYLKHRSLISSIKPNFLKNLYLLEEKANILRHLAIKYNISKNVEVISKIEKILDEIYLLEKPLYEEILIHLVNSCK